MTHYLHRFLFIAILGLLSCLLAQNLFAATSGHESELTETERDDLVARYLMHSVNDPDTVLADAIAE